MSHKGWRNHYKASMPLPEAIAKDFKFLLKDGLHFMRNGFSLPTIVAFPTFPSKKTTLYKVADQLHFRLTNRLIEHPRLVIYFEDLTHGSSAEVRKKYPHSRILNEACIDISKEKVNDVHERIFGYHTFINPLTYQGKAVQKSDTNALHDGQIIHCPIPARVEGSVYQVLINNNVNDQLVVDFRVPVVGDTIPLVYKKFKTSAQRFTNEVQYAELHAVNDYFSVEEQQTLIAFAKAMGADYCELDVLRNSDDGKIYAIDVNKTPYGPPANLPLAEKKKAVVALTTAFQQAFL